MPQCKVDYLLDELRKCLLNAQTWKCDYRGSIETSDLPGQSCVERRPGRGLTFHIEIDGGAVNTLVTFSGVQTVPV